MATKAKPAEASGGHRTITVCNWKPLENGSLRGFLTLTLANGVVIHNCQLLEVGGRRWVGLPSRRFLMADGRVHYEPIIEFTTRKAYWQFERTALEVVEAYLKARGEW
jgi:DNA-binding cell septation regulator SpoVG